MIRELSVVLGAIMFIGGMVVLNGSMGVSQAVTLPVGFVIMIFGGMLMAVEMSRW